MEAVVVVARRPNAADVVVFRVEVTGDRRSCAMSRGSVPKILPACFKVCCLILSEKFLILNTCFKYRAF